MNPYAHCTYHVFAFVQKTPGCTMLTEECQACHMPTGRTKRGYVGRAIPPLRQTEKAHKIL